MDYAMNLIPGISARMFAIMKIQKDHEEIKSCKKCKKYEKEIKDNPKADFTKKCKKYKQHLEYCKMAARYATSNLIIKLRAEKRIRC